MHSFISSPYAVSFLQPDAPLLELEGALPGELRADSVPPVVAGLVAGLPLVRA